MLNCNKIKDCIISLETFENEIEYPFIWKDFAVKLEKEQNDL